MIVFREDLYGLDVLTKNKYQTEKNHGFERCVLVRYMANNGYNKEEIISSLRKLSRSEFAYLSKEKKDKIYEICDSQNKNINIIVYEYLNGKWKIFKFHRFR